MDVRISPFAIIRHKDLVSFGDHVAIDEFTLITVRANIGNYVHIPSHCSIIGGVNSTFIMEDFSNLSAGCRIICGTDDFSGEAMIGATLPAKYRKVEYSTVTLERHSCLGTGCIVFPGVTIGEGTVVSAGTIIHKSLPSWGVYGGSPVRRIKERPYKTILQFEKELSELL